MASKFNNPPAFKATGQGYFNKLPNFPATAQNANGIFENLGRPPGDPLRLLYTFITGVWTDWQIAGTYGQSPGARTFYPKNLSQSEITVRGIVANQFEYDRIVQFVQAHHHTAIDLNEQDRYIGTRAIDFKLLPFRIPIATQQGVTQYYYVHRAMHYKGFITQIEAGHERFITAPTFTFTFRVQDDFLQEPVNLQGEFNQQLAKNYLTVFGSFYQGPSLKGTIPLPPPNSDGFGDTPDNADFWNTGLPPDVPRTVI